MRYKAYLIIIIMLAMSCQDCFGEDQRYRVELIVLRHLEGFSEQPPVTVLTDFTAALDLLAPPPLETATDQVGSDNSGEANADLAPPATGEEEILVTEPEEPVAVLIETPGDMMQQAWRRLRSSSGFRPELYLSWEQADREPYPSIRVHDQELVLEEDPWAELRLAQTGDTVGTVFSDTGLKPAPGSQTGVDFITGEETLIAALPEPTRYYRIDGTARFSKSRFLHLDLDIELRELLFGDQDQEMALPAAISDDELAPPPTAFQVHRVHQSRQVQSQEMEYFDGPVFAILVLISRVEVSPPEPMSEIPQATEPGAE